MSTVRMPNTALDDGAWDDLLSYVEEKRVYANSLCDAARRAALRAEAESLVDSAPVEMRRFRVFREVRDRIHAPSGTAR